MQSVRETSWVYNSTLMISKQCYGYVKAPWRDTWKQNVPSSRSGLNRHFNILYSGLSLSVIEDVEAGTTTSRYVWKICLSSIFISLNSTWKFSTSTPQKRKKSLLYFCSFLRAISSEHGRMEVEIFPPHTSFCFGLPASTAPSRFAVNGEEPLLRKKKKPSINHFLGNGSLIQQDGLSDDLQLLVINANSDLWPAVLHQNSSSTASSPRSKRPSAYWSPVMLAPQPCSSLYCFLHFFFSSLYKFSSVGELSTLASLIFGCRGCRSRSSFGSNRWTPCCHIIMKPQILYRAPLVCLLLFGSYENVLSLIRLSSKRHFLPHILPIISHSEQNGRACARLRVRLREHLQKFHLSSCFAAEFHIAHYK